MVLHESEQQGADAPGGASLLPASLLELRRDPDALNLALNALVVGLFVAFAAYKLATVDMEISRGWTWWEVLLRAPGDNFYRYEATVSAHPIITKAFTSCTAYGIGDFVAQLFQGKNIGTMDLKRSGRSALAGLLVHGPLCHYWIEIMQEYLDFGGAWWNFIPKVIADQTGWSLFLNAAYTTFVYGLQGRTPAQIWAEIKDTAWPALSSSWRFWPLIHCVSFSNAIPKDLKLLFIDCMEVVWVTILSTVANKDNQHAKDVLDPAVDPATAVAMATADDGEAAPTGGGGKVMLDSDTLSTTLMPLMRAEGELGAWRDRAESRDHMQGLAVAAAVAVAAATVTPVVAAEGEEGIAPPPPPQTMLSPARIKGSEEAKQDGAEVR